MSKILDEPAFNLFVFVIGGNIKTMHYFGKREGLDALLAHYRVELEKAVKARDRTYAS